MDYLKRLVRMLIGLTFCGTGSYFIIQANIGLGPWEAFHIGLSNMTGIMYGNVSIIVGAFIVIIDLVLKEKIGFGTVLNAIIYPKWVDVWNAVGLIEKRQSMLSGFPLLLLGMTMVAVGTWLYMGCAMGSGPRDSMIVGVNKRFPKAPVGVIKASLELFVVAAGFLMGAKIGVGTLIILLCQSSVLQIVLNIVKFDVKAVKHENFADTIRNISGAKV